LRLFHFRVSLASRSVALALKQKLSTNTLPIRFRFRSRFLSTLEEQLRWKNLNRKVVRAWKAAVCNKDERFGLVGVRAGFQGAWFPDRPARKSSFSRLN